MEENKSSKSGILLIIIFVILCATALIGFLIINGNDKDPKKDNEPIKEEKKEVSYYDFDVCTYDEIYESDGNIYSDDGIIYECQSTGEFGCYLTRIDDFEYCNRTDSIVMITDNQKDFLYDYNKKEVVLEVTAFEKVIYNELGDVAYFVFKENDKEGIATLTGKVLLEPTYDFISVDYGNFSGEYSLKNGTVVVGQNNKQGVIEIETGNIVVPLEYDGINIYDEYYVLRNSDSVVLSDLKLNVVFDEDVDDIAIFNDVIFAEKDKKLSFYDLEGNKIVEDTVNINRSYSNYDDKGYSVYTMDQYNQVITLSIYGDSIMDYEACYNLHLVDKKLETLDCKEIFDDLDD